MSLRERDIALQELMDDPACDPARLAATLRRFDIVNRLVSGWGRVYRQHLAPHFAELGRPARVLDIGSGGGDVLARLAAHAGRDGFDVDWLGIDPDPRALAVASTRETTGMRFRQADAAAVLADGTVFDAVLSNHVLHHLDETALIEVTEQSRALSTGPVLHSDIARSRLAHALYGVAILPLAPGTFLRTDGLRSIRRSYRAHELGTVLGDAWHIEQPAPFRLLAVGRGRA